MSESEVFKFLMRPYRERKALISPEGMELIRGELKKLPPKQQEYFRGLLKINTIIETDAEDTPKIILKAKKRNAEEWVQRIHMLQVNMRRENIW